MQFHYSFHFFIFNITHSLLTSRKSNNQNRNVIFRSALFPHHLSAAATLFSSSKIKTQCISDWCKKGFQGLIHTLWPPELHHYHSKKKLLHVQYTIQCTCTSKVQYNTIQYNTSNVSGDQAHQKGKIAWWRPTSVSTKIPFTNMSRGIHTIEVDQEAALGPVERGGPYQVVCVPYFNEWWAFDQGSFLRVIQTRVWEI